jgi:DNA-binding HxlR family transcriptional regulator
MARIDLSTFSCSVARTLDVVGDKWTLLVLRDAFYGVRRFDEFQADLGIARNVLTDRLTRLVEEGVLDKVAYEQRPPRFEYRLTAKGRDLFPVILAMTRWGDRWTWDGEPRVDLIHTDCGQAMHAEPVCSSCGGELHPRNVRATPLPDGVEEALARRRAAGQ